MERDKTRFSCPKEITRAKIYDSLNLKRDAIAKSTSSGHGSKISQNPFILQDNSLLDKTPSSVSMVSSSMEMCIGILKKLRAKAFENDIADINFVIETLTSNQQYAPVFLENILESTSGSSTAQPTIKKWIMDEFMAPVTNSFPLRKTFAMNTESTMRKSNWNNSLSQIDKQALRRLRHWDYDIFELARYLDGSPLMALGLAVFDRLDLVRKFNININKLKSFLQEIQDGYLSTNPYHNGTHAADVTQAIYFFITTAGAGRFLTDLDVLALIVAALVHDFQHPGVTNTFLVKAEAPKALLYNDCSVLENHHLTQAFIVLKKSENNIFENLTLQEYREVRESIIRCVFATDMAKHFENLGLFKSRLESTTPFDPTSREDRLLLMKTLMKAADINNTTRDQTLAIRWAMRIMEEFFQQGDLEKEKQLEVSPFMDRETTSIPKCQLSFIDYIVSPYYEPLARLFKLVSLCVNNLQANRAFWKQKQKLEKMVKTKVEKNS